MLSLGLIGILSGTVESATIRSSLVLSIALSMFLQLPLSAGAAVESGVPFAPAPTLVPKSGHIELNINDDPKAAEQQQAPLTLLDFERLAETHNPTMIQAARRSKASRAKRCRLVYGSIQLWHTMAIFWVCLVLALVNLREASSPRRSC
jgi:hypothetical protein